MFKKVWSLLLVLMVTLGSMSSFAAAKSISFPKEGLPVEVVYTEKNPVQFSNDELTLTISKVSAEDAKESYYKSYSAAQKKYLYSYAIEGNEGNEGNGFYDFSYVKYSGKNGVFNIYDSKGKIIKNATLTISKDGKTITIIQPNSEDPKKPYKDVLKLDI